MSLIDEPKRWTNEHDSKLENLEYTLKTLKIAGASYPRFVPAEGDATARLGAIRDYFQNFSIAGPNVESQGNVFTGLAVNQICP